MPKPKWLGIIAVLLLLPLFSIAAAPAQADSNQWKTMHSQPGHFRSPIHYGQVARPIRPDKSGAGPTATSVVYTPQNIQTAYSFVANDKGTGKTIAIVAAFGDPTLAADVTAFNSRFSLSPAGKVNTYYPDGQPSSTNSSDAAGWAIETALDVEWAHANAQGATIDLVVAYDDSFQHLLNAVKYACGQYSSNYAATLSPLPTAVSMSFGAPEDAFTAATAASILGPWETAFSKASSQGIILLAASGDGGATDGTGQATVEYPAASQYVIGVGGTTLLLTSGRYGSETAWSGSGGGYGAASLKSTLGGEPVFQKTANISDSAGMRGVPDVAFDADPNTGLYVCCANTWYDVGGTSAGSPNWAAIIADAAAAPSTSSNSSSSVLLTPAKLYSAIYSGAGKSLNYADGYFHDVTIGNNGQYSAAKGWDAVTGIGTPVVSGLVTLK